MSSPTYQIVDRKGGEQLGDCWYVTKKITSNINTPVIASGGVGKLEHFTQGALETGASGLLAASVFHYGKFTINQVKKELNKNGVPVRL